jgi:hypothetical protein
LQEWSLSVRVRPQAPRLRRAASRLWGLKARIALQEWSLSVSVRPQAPRLRRAASRLWGLTAQRDRANKAVQPTGPHCDPVRVRTTFRLTSAGGCASSTNPGDSDRSRLGFRNLT